MAQETSCKALDTEHLLHRFTEGEMVIITNHLNFSALVLVIALI